MLGDQMMDDKRKILNLFNFKQLQGLVQTDASSAPFGRSYCPLNHTLECAIYIFHLTV